MITVSLPLRFYTVPLPYPRSTAALVFLLLLLVVLLVRAGRWWWSTRDEPVGRGQPYGRVIPDPEWKEPPLPGSPAELGEGRREPNA